MIKLSQYISFLAIVVFLTGCSQVLQTVDLNINAEDNSLQEEFNVVEKTLTISEAKKQKAATYSREVLKSGRGESAKPIPEKLALKSEYPKKNLPIDYKIGIGDTISFSRLIENNRSTRKKSNTWPQQNVERKYQLGIGDTLALTLIRKTNDLNTATPRGLDNNENSQSVIINPQQSDSTIETKGRIGSDGSVLLLEVGRLEANGKSLNELRSEVRNILIRNSVSPRFQLEIVDFKSQKSYLTINSRSQVILLNDQKTTMRDILTSANVGVKPGIITRIRLQRNGKEFSISLRELYGLNAYNIDIQPDDHIFVEDSSANIRVTSSIVDHEGNVVFESIGKVRVAGLTLNKLKKNIENLTQPVSDSQNAFQIQITKFASQKALFSIQGKPGFLIPITDTPTKVSEVLTQNGLSIDGNHITQISLQRGRNTYVFNLGDLLNPDSPDIYIQPDDHIIATILPYKENKIFIVGGVFHKFSKSIQPTKSPDVLFTGGGALSASSAKRSGVYLKEESA